jgi:hypothetical protein
MHGCPDILIQMLITVELAELAATVLQKFRTSTSKTLVVVAPTRRLSRGRKAGKITKDRKDGAENEKNSDQMVTHCTPRRSSAKTADRSLCIVEARLLY